MYAIGLMSGTSLDGLDVAIAEINGVGITTNLQLIAMENVDLPPKLKERIKQACDIEQSNVELICSLNFEIGKFFAEGVKQACQKNNIPLAQIDFIASHGQTIYHIPQQRDDVIPSTLQIGDSAVIAYETKTQVISNFRTMDMAAGGQGAPLVPYSEFILYGNKGKNLLLQNIGGIGNVTFVPAKSTLDAVFAFDTGPGNMIIDELMLQLFNKTYDKDGKTAQAGQVNQALLSYMQDNKYFDLNPPKSTGRELFGAQYVQTLCQKFPDLPKVDYITTATMFTAWSIANQYQRFIFPKQQIDAVILSGGGAYNKTLRANLQQLLPQLEVLIQEDVGYDSNAKEALAFIILGNETLNHRPSNVPSVTGAKEHVILGELTIV